MSKRLKTNHDNGYPKQKGSNYQLWLGGLAALVVAVVGVVLFTRSSDPASEFEPQVTGAPRLAVAQEVFDYGDVKLGTTVETVFEIQNVGDQELRIAENPPVRVVEGC